MPLSKRKQDGGGVEGGGGRFAIGFDESPKAAPQPGDLERAIFSPMNQLAGLLWLSVGLRCKSLPREL
jgi:hypothetical protein